MKQILFTAILALCSLVSCGQPRETVAILGDSYSTFEGYVTPDTMELWYFKNDTKNRTDVDKVRQTWWWQVVSRGGYKLGINNSWSGATICNTGYNDADFTHESFLTRVGALGNPDIILVFGGTNDAWAGVPLGEYKYDNIKRAERYCLRPAAALLLSEMQERYPNAKIYVIVNCDLDEAYTESLHTIAKHYGITSIQLHDIDKKNGHPTIAGMKSIADQVLAVIKQ